MPRKCHLGQRAATMVATREKILQATIALHKEQGVVATSDKDIARRADVGLDTVRNGGVRLARPLPAATARPERLVITLEAPDHLRHRDRDKFVLRKQGGYRTDVEVIQGQTGKYLRGPDSQGQSPQLARLLTGFCQFASLAAGLTGDTCQSRAERFDADQRLLTTASMIDAASRSRSVARPAIGARSGPGRATPLERFHWSTERVGLVSGCRNANQSVRGDRTAAGPGAELRLSSECGTNLQRSSQGDGWDGDRRDAVRMV
jgi:hypothetical protein